MSSASNTNVRQELHQANGPFVSVTSPVPTAAQLLPNEVLVKVAACGVCHSDTLTKMGHFPGITYPRVCGHEVVGSVVAVGSGVPASSSVSKVGTRVARGWLGSFCFACESCRRGDFVTCLNQTVTGIHDDGGYQQFMRAPWNSLALVPDSLTAIEAAPLACAGVTVFNSLRNAGAKPPSLVAVMGIGGLGHLAIQFASKSGYTVAAISRGTAKKQLAHDLGAHHYIDSQASNAVAELKKLGGASVILATAFDAKAMSELIDGLGVNGVLVVLGVDTEQIKVSPLQLIMHRKRILGWPSGTPMDVHDTLNFAAKHGVKSMNECYPLTKAEDAFSRMLSGKALFRVVLQNDL